MIVDPEELRRLARKIAMAATEVRDGAQRSERVAGVQWESTAAEKFRRQLSDDVRSTLGAANELDELEQSLLDHAQAVQFRLAEIAAAKQWAEDQAAAAREWAEKQGGAVRDAVDSAVDDLIDGGWVL